MCIEPRADAEHATSRIPELPRISDYLAHHARECPEQDALVLGAERWSYRRFQQEVDAFAKALLRSGVRKGDRVGFLSTPRPECFLAFLASASIGAISVGLNPKFPLEELDYFVGDSEPTLLLGFSRDAEGEHGAILAELGRRHVGIARTVAFGDGDGATTWQSWLARGEESEVQLASARDAVASSAPALIVYTSGTTGRPKGAVLPHRGLVRCSVVQMERWHTEPTRLLINLPVNHIGFMGDLCCGCLVAGGTGLFMEKFDPLGVLELIERERVTLWGQIPTLFQLTLEAPGFAKRDLSSVQRIIWGGAPAPHHLVKALHATGATVGTSFGMTETTGSITYTSDDDDLDTLADSIGRPDPHFEVRLVRPDGVSVRPSETGEILVRGDHIMLGYWRNSEATAAAIDDRGWLHTGDVAVLREDGSYALRGRMREMYKSGGENVYPPEVERVLEEHPDVVLAAAIGVPDPIYGEVGHAHVVRRPGTRPTEALLRAFCRERLVNFKVPRRVFVRESLPMLPVGKVDKRALEVSA